MFNFLKKKLKKFEKELEDEIQSEIEEEQIQEEHVLEEKIPEKKEKEEQKFEKVVEEPKEEKKPVLRKRARKEKPVSKEKKQKEEQLDKQIEESIQSELNRIVKTRKSIEETTISEEKTSGKIISEDKLNDLLWDLEMGLLESDVAYSVIDSIKKDIRQEIKKTPFSTQKTGSYIENILKNAISHVLVSSTFDFDEFVKNSKKPAVIMFVGVNGTGKTLSIAKVTRYLKDKGVTCVMAAGDTFRAGAIEQLTIHANNLGVKIVKHGPNSDPAAVAYDAIEHAKAKHKDIVLLDTAGRMQTNSNLMDEMAKIKRVAKPDLIIFVGDALSGNDAVEQAKRFNEVVGIDGVILTKVDTDAKGGSSLSIAYTIGKPLLFVGVGQEYEDQIPFDPDWMIENLFGKEEA